MKGKCFHFALAILVFGLVVSGASARSPGASARSPGASARSPADAVYGLMATINGHLEDMGADYRAEVAEYITYSEEQGQTIVFRDVGNKQTGFHFVPRDPRRGGTADITYMVDQVDAAPTFPPGALPIGTTTDAIDRAMATWDAVNCSTIPITRIDPIPGFEELGVVENIIFGSPPALVPVVADITHAGWVTNVRIVPPPILGITLTFGFIDLATGFPTDFDNNGKGDVAFREIYYSAFAPWGDGVTNFDVETVALHEAGHGLGQAHFGKLFRTDKNGRFHFAPRAVMNTGYTGPQRSLRGTDNGGHCSIWASWPSN